MARYDDLNTNAIAYTTFVSAIILLLLILLGRALCYTWIEAEDEHKLADAHYVSSDQEISEQKQVLTGYKKVQVELPPAPGETDPQAEPQVLTEERVHIPIQRAESLLLEELASEPSA